MQIFAVLVLVASVACGSENDIVFREVDGQALALDVAIPEGSGPFPLVVCIHGGGWRTGGKATWNENRVEAQINIHEFAKRGYVAATVNYRLAPAYKLPAMLDDIRVAVDFLLAEYKIDPQRIAFAGDSAGGHLALMSGITLRRAGYGVRGVINMFGLTDCTDVSAAVNNGRLSYVVADFVGSDDPASALALAASPARLVDSGSPPVLTLHGTEDVTISFAQALVLKAALKGVGVKNELVPMRKQGHGWGDPKAVKISTKKVFDFLKRIFKE